MTATIELDEIPGPRRMPLIGYSRDVDAEHPIESAMRLAKEYGPIFKLSTPTGDQFVVSGAELVSVTFHPAILLVFPAWVLLVSTVLLVRRPTGGSP